MKPEERSASGSASVDRLLNIVMACSPAELTRERAGYADAFRSLCNFSASPVRQAPDVAKNSLLIYPDPPNTSLPRMVHSAQCATACFQIDTFIKPSWKALWACLFDYVFVFHPGFSSYFQEHGHERVIVLPHAVDHRDVWPVSSERTFVLGFVGSLEGPQYLARRRVLPQLDIAFRMNEWRRRYAESAVKDVYRQSRIVVNIAHDAHPSDANLRCFDAMAAGALLVTSIPSELEQIGFRRGSHFVGYTSEGDIAALIAEYARNATDRNRIAHAGQALVLAEHTYLQRVRTIMRIVEGDRGRYFAPSRNWSSARVDFAYMHYHCKHGNLSAALSYFNASVRRSPLLTARSLPLLARCLSHRWKNAAGDPSHLRVRK